MLKKIINALRGKRDSQPKLLAEGAVASNVPFDFWSDEFSSIFHNGIDLDEEQFRAMVFNTRSLVIKASMKTVDVGNPSQVSRLLRFMSIHLDDTHTAHEAALAHYRQEAHRLESELRQSQLAHECDLVVLQGVTSHKRVLLENQNLFSKDEWLARAAEGKRHPHSGDEYLGVPDDLVEEAKATYEATKHEHDEIVRHNGSYMITVNEHGVQVLKDMLAGVGGIEERETFEPITVSQRKYDAALKWQQGKSNVVAFPVAK